MKIRKRRDLESRNSEVKQNTQKRNKSKLEKIVNQTSRFKDEYHKIRHEHTKKKIKSRNAEVKRNTQKQKTKQIRENSK